MQQIAAQLDRAIPRAGGGFAALQPPPRLPDRRARSANARRGRKRDADEHSTGDRDQPAAERALRPRDVARAFGGERLVIEVKKLVVEALQGSFGDGDEPYQQVQAGQLRPGLDQV